MRARAVIGANFGDEGKGLVTDYLASTGGDVVVRFNGGCQAGHTVVTPEGQRHVFSHFGSGSFVGLPTFFSQHTIINPVLFLKELADIKHLGVSFKVYIHPDARVTTPWDMNKNQDLEVARLIGKIGGVGDIRHGSCGVGIFETIKRNKKIPLLMTDLCTSRKKLARQIDIIREHYSALEDDHLTIKFITDCVKFVDIVEVADIYKFKDPIFEGAQGLLLDQGNLDMYPHLTPSRCGMHNVRELCFERGIQNIDSYYISRTYLTRHGVGPLPGEFKTLKYKDQTNVENEWQGPLRFGVLHARKLLHRIHADCHNPHLVLTHCDQRPPEFFSTFYSYGETRESISYRP